jgi:TPR repeat protein
MRSRYGIFLFMGLAFFASRAFPQSNSPEALQSTARALTVGELPAVAERADAGDAASQVLLGLSFRLLAEHLRDEEGQAEMYRSAVYWLRKAAEKGSAPAQYFLAETDLTHSTAVQPGILNCEEVLPSLNKAISQNYPFAMTALGHRYIEGGCYFKVDYALGLEWLKKASTAGDPEANYWIGEAYADGNGVKRDQTEANRWFLKGAEMDDADSQDALAVNLAEGNGTPKNLKEAVDWFRKSAEQGHQFGTCNLALHYMRGQGVAKDLVLSLMWGLISDRVTTGNYCLEEIDTRPFLKMTKAEEAEATQRANAWLKAHHYPPTEPPTHDNE